MTPRTVIRGDARHGVNRYARTVAAHLPEGDEGRAHVHFTDRLWGSSPESAAARFERFAARVPTTVTLHDVPQPSDGTRYQRRSSAYARVSAAARSVACSSRHEAALLKATAHVVPHYVQTLGATAPGPTEDNVAVLGFIYPGKGHAEVVEAAAGPVVFLGGPAPGHEADVAVLRARAEARGVSLTVTGYLDDAELLRRMRRVGVPVAAHQHLSASGSIATWIGAGRRPLVADGPYTRELAAGTVTRYTDLAAALREPAATWLASGVDPGPSPRATADAYRAWWAEVDW